MTGYVESGAIAYFDVENPGSYSSGSETMYDLLGSDLTMVTVSGLVPPITDDGLDFSTQTNYMQTSEQVVIRTISLWYTKLESTVSNPLFMDQGEYGYIVHKTVGSAPSIRGDFFTSCTVYVDGVETSMSDWNDLPTGELHNIVFMGSQSSVSSILTIFANSSPAYTFKAILYSICFYDRELTVAELLQNFNSGSGGGLPKTLMNTTPSVFDMNISWPSNDLASSYKINYVGTDSSEGSLITSETNVRVGSLTPDTEYVLTLYYAEANSFSMYGDPLTISTLENNATNYNITDYEDDTGRIDLTSLGKIERSLMEEHLNDLFDDGASMKQTVQGKSLDTTFVKIGSIVDATSGTNAFSLPFTTSSGAGQEVTMSTSTGDISVSYDESTEQVTINGTSYSDGEYLIVDGKKMIVYNI